MAILYFFPKLLYTKAKKKKKKKDLSHIHKFDKNAMQNVFFQFFFFFFFFFFENDVKCRNSFFLFSFFFL